MKDCVLGAGVAGMTSAYFLAQDGHDVTVVERNAGVGLETSYANGGQLSYSYVAPLAGPGVLPKVPPWLMKRDAPLRFSPRLDYDQWRFCVQFVLACTAAQSEITTARLLRLSFYSRALMHAMVARETLDFDYVRNGKLVFYSDAESLRGAMEMMEYQKSLGCEQAAFDRMIRPALAEMARRGTPFRGFLFAGLMLTEDGPKLIEYNARFGDPECEVLLPRLKSDLLPALQAACESCFRPMTSTSLKLVKFWWPDLRTLRGCRCSPKRVPS